jgi:exopolyphosphatase / guanosine-5'-triphosphate,3'-diphosphate pyrophosphatase
MTDAITLQPELPPESTRDPRKDHDSTLAAIDVGTNSIHMVIAKIQPSIPAFTIIAREKSTVRLGDRDPETGDLTPAAIHRAMTALTRCQEVAKRVPFEKRPMVQTF